MNFRLWGKGAQPKPGASEADSTVPKEAEKVAASSDEDEDDDEKEDDDKKKAGKKDDDQEDEAKAAHDAAVAASSGVAAAARQAIVFLERERVHAIVQAGGKDRVGQALHVALNSDMTAAQAAGFLEATSPDHRGVAPTDAGRLGLRGDMATRRAPRLGADRGGDSGRSSEQRELDDTVDSVLAFVPGAARKS